MLQNAKSKGKKNISSIDMSTLSGMTSVTTSIVNREFSLRCQVNLLTQMTPVNKFFRMKTEK